MTWTLVCSRCGAEDCACEVDEYTREQRRRLKVGMEAVNAMPEDASFARDVEALRRVTTGNGYYVDFDPPSMTDWQRDVESARMREL